MLYGFNPNNTTTIVTAGDNIASFKEWYASLGGELYVSVRETDFMDQLSDPVLEGIETEVYIFTFDHDFNQSEFARIHDIVILKSSPAIDRNADMYMAEQPDPYDVNDNRTIEDIHGLAVEDRYDKRDDAEKEEDAAFRAKIQDMKKNDQISGESFSPVGQSKVSVTQINTSMDSVGNVTIENVSAVKYSETDGEKSKEQREKLVEEVAVAAQEKAEKAVIAKENALKEAVIKSDKIKADKKTK